MKVSEIAGLIGAKLEGNADLVISGVGKIEEAGPGEITFLANPKYKKYFETTKASAVIVSENFEGDRNDVTLLKTRDPYMAFVFTLRALAPPPDLLPPGIDPSARIAANAVIASDVRIGALACVRDGAHLNKGVSISPGCVIGEDVQIGENSFIYPNVTIYRGSKLGRNVTVHSGTVIGADGFGFAPKVDGGYEKIPQLGIVVIEDDVEIGSNCSIDRATLGETKVCRGVKIDNLVQIAHNVFIGENTVIAAQAGISGSTRIGKHCMIGGQVGFVGHIEIADNTSVGAQSGVSKGTKVPGKTLFGYPAVEIRDAKRIEGAMKMLPDMIREVTALRHEVDKLKDKE